MYKDQSNLFLFRWYPRTFFTAFLCLRLRGWFLFTFTFITLITTITCTESNKHLSFSECIHFKCLREVQFYRYKYVSIQRILKCWDVLLWIKRMHNWYPLCLHCWRHKCARHLKPGSWLVTSYTWQNHVPSSDLHVSTQYQINKIIGNTLLERTLCMFTRT